MTHCCSLKPELKFFLKCCSLFFLLLDIFLDVWTCVKFYREKEFIRLGLLGLILLGSSLLVQAYSWLWYKYEDFRRETRVERGVSVGLLKVLHLLQLGTFVRYLGGMEIEKRKFLFAKGKAPDPGAVADYLSHDVAMLRVVDTFSESVPQLLLMVTTYIQRGHLDHLRVLKSFVSAIAASYCVTSYHRSLRRCLKDKHLQPLVSSVVYFLWNVLLLAPRTAALCLFASQFPLFLLPHLLCSWALLSACAWRADSDFMGGDLCGERLFRSTVGLVWYFNWFDAVKEKHWHTRLYHGYIMADIALLCGLWFWKMNPDLRNFNYEHLIAYFCIFFVYVFGLLVKSMYYYHFHPKVTKEDLKSDGFSEQNRSSLNRRMMTLANNFYLRPV